MGVFENFPYTNFHDMNLDWILKALRELEHNVSDFVSLNAIKYADPLQWDITKQYEKNTIVIDPKTGTAYISVREVPAGTDLQRSDYWTVVFDLEKFYGDFKASITKDNGIADNLTFDVLKDELFWYKNIIRIATVNIAAGATPTDQNSNIITLESWVNSLISALRTYSVNLIDAEEKARIAADNALEMAYKNADNALEMAYKNADNELSGRITDNHNDINSEIVDREAEIARIDGELEAERALRRTEYKMFKTLAEMTAAEYLHNNEIVYVEENNGVVAPAYWLIGGDGGITVTLSDNRTAALIKSPNGSINAMAFGSDVFENINSIIKNTTYDNIIIPAGTFNTNVICNITRPVSIRGEGAKNTIIRTTTSGIVYMVTNAENTKGFREMDLSGFALIGDYSLTTRGIDVNNTLEPTDYGFFDENNLHELWIEGFNVGIYIPGRAIWNTFSNMVIIGCTIGFQHTGQDLTFNLNTFTNVSFRGCTENSILIIAKTNYKCSNNIFNSCDFGGEKTQGVANYVQHCDAIIFNDCWFENNNKAGGNAIINCYYSNIALINCYVVNGVAPLLAGVLQDYKATISGAGYNNTGNLVKDSINANIFYYGNMTGFTINDGIKKIFD